MRRFGLILCVMTLAAAGLSGCGNPLKRPPANVFPGSEAYEKRVAELKLSPQEAHDIAYGAARKDGRLHLMSRRPTVILKKTYVFSMPLASGASLNGYHVDGDKGTVRYVSDKKVVAAQ